jgi:hypothetical protein
VGGRSQSTAGCTFAPPQCRTEEAVKKPKRKKKNNTIQGATGKEMMMM